MTHTAQPPRRGEYVPTGQATPPQEPDDDKTPDDLSPVAAHQIDENLRLLYRQRIEQELPDELRALVAQLRDGDGA